MTQGGKLYSSDDDMADDQVFDRSLPLPSLVMVLSIFAFVVVRFFGPLPFNWLTTTVYYVTAIALYTTILIVMVEVVYQALIHYLKKKFDRELRQSMLDEPITGRDQEE